MDKEKKYFWILLDILILVAIINVIFFVMPMISSLRGSYAPARTITVSAQGTTSAAPDLAEVSFSVVTQGTDPQTLSSNNNDKMNAVLQFVSSQGISASDTATTAYDLQPNYQYDKTSGRSFITGYTLTQTVTIKIHDLSKIASILGGLAPLGVNQIGGVNFTFNDPNAVIGPARADAFAQAKAKAMDMAKQAGVSLGSIVNVSEGFALPRPYTDLSVPMAVGSSAGSAPNIQPGTQDITDSVTIIYALN